MAITPATPLPPIGIGHDTRNKQTDTTAGTGNFDALLKVAGIDPIHSFADNFIDTIIRTLQTVVTGATQVVPPNKFPFTPSFAATFGTSGPLLNFISYKTNELGLTAEQNQAFQQIAVNNKDATRTPVSIQKIAKELEAAGIGYDL